MITVYSLAAFRPEVKGIIRDIRTVWTLEELGLPYERKVMDAMQREHKQPDFLAINPFGKVPAIKDGDFTLFESAAICAYLGDKTQKLIPKPATRERALYDQWVSFTTSTLEPNAFRVFGCDFFQEKSEAVAKLRAEACATIDGMFGVLDTRLANMPYLLGEHFTLADVLLSSVVRSVEHTELAAKHASFKAYLDRNYARPAFLRAYENNG